MRKGRSPSDHLPALVLGPHRALPHQGPHLQRIDPDLRLHRAAVLPEEVNEAVLATSPYTATGRDKTNETDRLFTTANQVALSGDTSSGYSGAYTVGLSGLSSGASSSGSSGSSGSSSGSGGSGTSTDDTVEAQADEGHALAAPRTSPHRPPDGRRDRGGRRPGTPGAERCRPPLEGSGDQEWQPHHRDADRRRRRGGAGAARGRLHRRRRQPPEGEPPDRPARRQIGGDRSSVPGTKRKKEERQ